MAKRKHWTQLSQKKRAEFTAIRDDENSSTWQRGYAGEGAFRISDKNALGGESSIGGFGFLGFTDPETKIRRGIFNGSKEFADELKRLGYKRVKFNATIRDKDVTRDYKFNKYTSKKGFIFNRPVYRVK